MVVLGYLGLAGFLWLTMFHVALALGAPIGRMAWRGQYRVLPARLRWASAASALLVLSGALTVAQAAGFGWTVLPDIMIRPLLWAFAALFALSVLGNAVSDSRIERLHGVPMTLILVIATGGLAILS